MNTVGGNAVLSLLPGNTAIAQLNGAGGLSLASFLTHAQTV